MVRHYKLDDDASQNRSYLVRYDDELNDEQLEVVMAGKGPILVVAGAGSGKTRALTYRVARLIEGGTPASSILLVTFTNKASREMLSRVDQLVPGSSSEVWGGTFHSIGNRLLKRHGEVLGYGPNFTILDSEDASTVMESAISEMGIQTLERRFPKGDVLNQIRSWAINTDRNLEEFMDDHFPQFVPDIDRIREVFEKYDQKKLSGNLMDFDDLLLNWLKLLEHSATSNRLRAKFQYVLVDEYQDTNHLQAKIVDAMGAARGNITVVGDDAQAIYSFRGASFENIITFPLRHRGARVLKLEKNYRSSPQILDLANSSIRKNRYQFPKELDSVRSEGPLPALVSVEDVYEQAKFLGQRILELRDEGEDLGEIAVLYRSHFQSLELQMELQRRNIPYEIRSGVRFFEQAHIKDILAHLRLTVNPRDEISWKRALKLYPRVGERTAAGIWSEMSNASDPISTFSRLSRKGSQGLRLCGRVLDTISGASGTRAPAEAIRTVVEQFYGDHVRSRFANFSARLDDIEQLALHASGYESTSEFLADLSLDTNAVAGEEVAATGPVDERVLLSSVHQSKGLEWRSVFILGVNENRFPSARALRVPGGIVKLPASGSNDAQLATIGNPELLNEQDSEIVIPGEEEERRLFYVAMTRAKQELYVCFTRFQRDRSNIDVITNPSRFITELPAELFEEWRIG